MNRIEFTLILFFVHFQTLVQRIMNFKLNVKSKRKFNALLWIGKRNESKHYVEKGKY